MSQISPELFRQIVNLLSPQLESERTRRALLDEALGVNAHANTLKNQLDFSGSVGEFTPQLVRELIEYGALDSGEDALVIVLETAKGKVGADRAKQFERVIAELGTSAPESGKIVANNSKSSPSLTLILTVVGTIATVVSMIVAILALPGVDPRRVTPTLTLPATPIVIARTNLDIRRGPGPGFDVLGVLTEANQADVIGISADNVWYQVLLNDGRHGWVRAGNAASLLGNPGVIPVIIPTATATASPSSTPTPSDTPTVTRTPTHTSTPTDTAVPTATPTATFTAVPSNTPTNTPTPLPSDTPTATPTATTTHTPSHTPTTTNTPLPSDTPTSTPVKTYPCDAQIDPLATADVLRIVRQQPNPRAQIVGSVQRGEYVQVVERSEGQVVFFRVITSDRSIGWVPQEYLRLDINCPDKNN